MTEVYELIRAERERQDAKWGKQSHVPVTWAAILSEEAGEVAKSALELDYPAYLRELVQVAAVAVAAYESALRGSERCGKPGCVCCALLAPDRAPEDQR